MPRDDNPCRIYYATQSGRAKACARRTARLLRELKGREVRSYATLDDALRLLDDALRLIDNDNNNDENGSVSSWAATIQNTELLVLFVSTTGDGEQPDNMKQIWKQLLCKSLPSNLFQKTTFALFCLGDRAYGEQFCAAGRKLGVRLLQLGATLRCPVGYGDDGTPNGGVFADLDQWLHEELLPQLEAKPPASVPVPSLSSPPVIPASPYEIVVSELSTESPPCLARDEWSQPAFSESYRQFLDQLQPQTSYQYDPSHPNPLGPARVATSHATRQSNSSIHAPASSLVVCRVVQNDRLTAADWEQNTRHIRLEWEESSLMPLEPSSEPLPVASLLDATLLPYHAGDVAVVLPCNSDDEVQRFLDVLPTSLRELADSKLEVRVRTPTPKESAELCSFWPRHCTLRGWLTLCADIHALPEREDLRALAAYCNVDHHPSGSSQRDKLISLSETSDAALYVDYILREKRSWADVLHDFDSLRNRSDGDGTALLTLEALLALLTPIRPREFSIASSPTLEAHNMAQARASNVASTSAATEPRMGIELCVAVVKGRTPLGRSFHGLCSDYLARLEPSNRVRLWIRRGTFQGLPLELDDASTNDRFQVPVLCIGAGTGIAPLHGLILEREAVRKLQLLQKGHAVETISTLVGDTDVDRDNLLVFGCRKRSSDYYYESEWKALCEAGRLGLRTAFSQDQGYKIYVQQALRQANKETSIVTKHVLERTGAIYIAGGPRMARAVKDEIVEMLAGVLNGDEKQAKSLLTGLQRMGRFSIEAWS